MASILVSPEWKTLDLPRMHGTVMVIGAPDSGKSTFVRWLVGELTQHHEQVGWVDADIGQSTLGVPTTMNLVVGKLLTDPLPTPQATFFVGNTSPRGHMLPTVVGVHKLVRQGRRMRANPIVVDTTGLVAPEAGGGALKLWKIALLEPRQVIAFQRHGELVHILAPLVREPRLQVHVFPVSEAAIRTPVTARIQHRQAQYRRYFQNAIPVEIDYRRMPVYDLERAGPQHLLALQDRYGLTLGLGVVLQLNTRTITLVTPLRDLSRVVSLRFGAIRLNPTTGEELHSGHRPK